MRVVFTIAVIGFRRSTGCDMFTMFAKHDEKHFEVGDKASHMELFALYPARSQDSERLHKVRCYGCRKYVCILTVFYRNKLAFIVPTIVQGRSALSGCIPATHPYYDTFVNMSKMYEEVPRIRNLN
jgi:hypothetical protein